MYYVLMLMCLFNENSIKKMLNTGDYLNNSREKFYLCADIELKAIP